MKKHIVAIVAVLQIFFSANILYAGNAWTQKADFGGTARSSAVGFSIGSKGYIGTGYDGSYKKDFWEYDPVLDSWTQKADFGGTARLVAVGFSIDSKGYIGTGSDNSYKKDFWEYEPVSNAWTQWADFGGTERGFAVGFSIGGKGYIGTGIDGAGTRLKDFREYELPRTTPDPFTFADQTGVARRTVITSNAITVAGLDAAAPISIIGGAYSINGGSYTGASGTVNNGNTVTVRQTSSASYSTKTDATLTIGGASGTFSVTTQADTTGGKFTFVDQTGVALNAEVISNPITIAWIGTTTPISIIGGAYSINGGSYTGASGTVNIDDTVTVRQTSPGSYSTTTDATLTIGGASDTFSVTTLDDTLPDPFTFTDRTGVARSTIIASNTITVTGITAATAISITGGQFSVNGGSYTSAAGAVNNGDTVTVQQTSSASHSATTDATLTIGGASDTFSVTTKTADTWTQKADFGGNVRRAAAGFSIGSKGYIGTGFDNFFQNNFWEYDPAADTWTQKADFGGATRRYAVGFSVGSKGYIGTGMAVIEGYDTRQKDFWEYDPALDAWTQKADFGGTARHDAIGFSIGSKGYIGTGIDVNGARLKDFWEYDSTANTWTKKADISGTVRYGAVGFSIGSKGYLGTGIDGDGTRLKDFWEYDPALDAWTQKADFGGTARYYAVGFSIGSKGYIGTGYDGSYKKDFWEY
ncbi:MAG: hypothetical protein LLG97_00900, partial [Deltaproteobacteria bacterium]|nr:hypothetical protein [Deltaproteobacteria bacterium]